VLIKMLAVMLCGVIVLMQQAVQYADRFSAAFCFCEFATRSDQAFIAVGYIAAAGITHIVLQMFIMFRLSRDYIHVIARYEAIF
jgi:hypothetical protein